MEDFDSEGKRKLASFVRQALWKLMNDEVVLQLSWSGITKRMAKKSNLKELRAIKDLKGIVMLIKGKYNWPKKIVLALKDVFLALFLLSHKLRTTASLTRTRWQAKTSKQIAKTLTNIHWKKRQRVLDAKREPVDVNVAPIENDDTDE